MQMHQLFIFFSQFRTLIPQVNEDRRNWFTALILSLTHSKLTSCSKHNAQDSTCHCMFDYQRKLLRKFVHRTTQPGERCESACGNLHRIRQTSVYVRRSLLKRLTICSLYLFSVKFWRSC